MGWLSGEEGVSEFIVGHVYTDLIGSEEASFPRRGIILFYFGATLQKAYRRGWMILSAGGDDLILFWRNVTRILSAGVDELFGSL